MQTANACRNKLTSRTRKETSTCLPAVMWQISLVLTLRISSSLILFISIPSMTFDWSNIYDPRWTAARACFILFTSCKNQREFSKEEASFEQRWLHPRRRRRSSTHALLCQSNSQTRAELRFSAQRWHLSGEHMFRLENHRDFERFFRNLYTKSRWRFSQTAELGNALCNRL